MPESSYGRLLQREDSALMAAGFEPTNGSLWQKEGVLFGRGAALQNAQRELRGKGEPNHFGEEACVSEKAISWSLLPLARSSEETSRAPQEHPPEDATPTVRRAPNRRG
jgi:hypothetical protein